MTLAAPLYMPFEWVIALGGVFYGGAVLIWLYAVGVAIRYCRTGGSVADVLGTGAVGAVGVLVWTVLRLFGYVDVDRFVVLVVFPVMAVYVPFAFHVVTRRDRTFGGGLVHVLTVYILAVSAPLCAALIAVVAALG